VCGDGCGGTPPGGSWTGFGTCPSPPAGTTLTTFSVTGPKTLWVTDTDCTGDQFEVFDGATSLGKTSPVTNVCTCPSDKKGDPNAAWADSRYSKRTYCLGPGAHTIRIKVVQDPCGCTGGFYKVA
jgi:hypothetical protein